MKGNKWNPYMNQTFVLKDKKRFQCFREIEFRFWAGPDSIKIMRISYGSQPRRPPEAADFFVLAGVTFLSSQLQMA